MAETPYSQETWSKFYAGKRKPKELSYDAAAEPYEPVDAVAETMYGGGLMAFAGLVTSAVQNSLARQNVGLMGVFTRTGGSILAFGGVGAGFALGAAAAANLRQKKDSYNAAIGGALGGSVIGLYRRSLPTTISGAATLAVVMAAFEYTGGWVGYLKNPHDDVISYKEYLRKNRRRPGEESIMELGEGRGIYGPGYEERRAKRIKDRYGIDVPVGPQSAS